MPRQCIADLAREFENGELEPDRFRHADHVRVAWALLKHYEFFDALTRLRAGLKSLADRAGRPAAYHETITLAFLAMVYERLSKNIGADWETFALANADLLDKEALRARYSAPRLSSPEARRGFLLPDLSGVPG